MTKLGELLLEREWIQRGDLLRALRQQQQVGGRLGTCLLEMGTISEEELVHVLGVQHGSDPVSIQEIRQIPEDVRALLSAKFAVRCKAVPVKASHSKVHIAMVDPRDLACQDELAFAVGRRLVVRAAPEVRILEALERYYDEPMPKRVAQLLDRLNRQRYLWQEQEGGTGSGPTRPAATRQSRDLFPSGPSLTPPSLPVPPGSHRSQAEPARLSPPPVADLYPTPPEMPKTASLAAEGPAVEWPPPGADVEEPQGDTGGEKRTRLSAVSLSAGERAALYGGRAPAPASYEGAQARLGEAEDPDTVATLLVDFLRQEFDRVILVSVRRDQVAGWTGDGDGLDGAELAALSIPLAQPSIFLNLQQGSTFHLGPLPAMPAHRPLVALLGGEVPAECLVLPVRLGDRMVAAIYCDRNGDPLGGIDLESLRSLADAAARALERCILLKRQAQR